MLGQLAGSQRGVLRAPCLAQLDTRQPGAMTQCIIERARRSGRLKVVRPLPPKVVPSGAKFQQRGMI